MSDRLKIGFIGLGVMGGPMALHLARAGHGVSAFNRGEKRREEWQRKRDAEGLDAIVQDTPAGAAAGADIVFSCVGNDEDARAVLLGGPDGRDGALGAMRAGSVLVDHTTTSAAFAREVAELAQDRGIGFVDAPVSGGQAGAENGSLAIMCGGSAAAFEQALPAMNAYGRTIVHIGGPGAGQTAKMANQMCIAGVLGGLSEAIRLVQAAGVDEARVLEAVSGGAAQSWQMENRWQTMVAGKFDFGFALDWMRKDLRYALAEADRLGLASPVTALVDQLYAELQASGRGRLDTSALIDRLPLPRKGGSGTQATSNDTEPA